MKVVFSVISTVEVCVLPLQAIHVASQYGQTAFVNHIVAKYHADLNVPDNDGRSPLHWYD